MLKIHLVNMPFGNVLFPSIALTQLRAVLEQRFGDAVEVRISYLNHDYARRIGPEIYQGICDATTNTGIADWLFRQAAFPELEDNREAYFRRYYPSNDPAVRELRDTLQRLREDVGAFLDEGIAAHGLAEADVVGMSSMFGQNVPSFALARKLKSAKPGLLTLMGGANCESPMGQEIARHIPAVDFVFSGPGLRSLPQFIQCHLDGDLEGVHRIDGVFSSTNCGDARIRALGQELPVDEVLELDYESFLDSFEANLPDTLSPMLLFETSRGCWWGERAHCTFCGLNGGTMNYRAMSAANALKQFDQLFRYWPRAREFQCVDNIMPKEYIQDVFAVLKPPPGLAIFYEVKADLEEEDLRVLARAGVNRLQPGIEALSTFTLRLMRKGTTSTRNIVFLKNCLALGIQPVWNILVGFPGEREEIYARYVDVIPWMRHLPPPSGVFPVRFDRYSPYFVQARKFELDLHPLDYYRHIYPIPEEDLHNLAYYFADHNLTADYFGATLRWLSPMAEKHRSWRDRWDGRGEVPTLHFEAAGSRLVRDTRSGSPMTIDVGDVGRRLLDVLADSRKMEEVAAGLPDLSGSAIDRELGVLEEQGLVFRDEGRLVSLVLSEPAPPIDRELWL